MVTEFANFAEREGWAVIDGGPAGLRLIRTHPQERHPVQPGFQDDTEAWDFVVGRALAGSLPHRLALIALDDNERGWISKHVGVLTLILAMKLDTTVGETP